MTDEYRLPEHIRQRLVAQANQLHGIDFPHLYRGKIEDLKNSQLQELVCEDKPLKEVLGQPNSRTSRAQVLIKHPKFYELYPSLNLDDLTSAQTERLIAGDGLETVIGPYEESPIGVLERANELTQKTIDPKHGQVKGYGRVQGGAGPKRTGAVSVRKCPIETAHSRDCGPNGGH